MNSSRCKSEGTLRFGVTALCDAESLNSQGSWMVEISSLSSRRSILKISDMSRFSWSEYD